MSSTETATTAGPSASRERDPSMLYVGDLMTYQHAFAAIHGQNEGLLTPGDLPPRPADGLDPTEWQRESARVLEESGALDSYRRMLAADVFVAECPFWCMERHEALASGGAVDDAIRHERKLLEVTFSGTDSLNEGRTTTLVLEQWQRAGKPATPELVMFGAPDEMSVSDAAGLGAALLRAAEMAGPLHDKPVGQ